MRGPFRRREPTSDENRAQTAQETPAYRGLGVTVYDLLRGTPWLRRPIHPALSYLPIGSWLTAMVLDLLGQKRGADSAIALGNFGALPTMLTGCIDWYPTTGQKREVGFVHMCVNCTGMMFYQQSLQARSAGHRALGVALSGVGLATILVGSWIGTDLVVDFGMGISPSAWDWLRRRREGDRTDQQTRQEQVSQGGFAMMGMCPMCGRMMGGMMGGGQPMQPPGSGQSMPSAGGGQSMQGQSMHPRDEASQIRQEIQRLQQRLDELETTQRLQEQVRQLEERIRAMEQGGQKGNR